MVLKIDNGVDDRLVEVLDLQQLFDPFAAQLLGRLRVGVDLHRCLREPRWLRAQRSPAAGVAVPAGRRG